MYYENTVVGQGEGQTELGQRMMGTANRDRNRGPKKVGRRLSIVYRVPHYPPTCRQNPAGGGGGGNGAVLTPIANLSALPRPIYG